MSNVDINVDRRTDGRTDGRTENRTPISHLATSRCDKKQLILSFVELPICPIYIANMPEHKQMTRKTTIFVIGRLRVKMDFLLS